ncbi:cyclic AMP-responsive element-binding protein 3-like protein 3-A [Dunckerocampus dactyliophorus]|uniref:cyclic AMP-responsive element-binding protein 3-like protein 3-A n=1 Tax=Dunckerocampus dactyliophorus TaxID=161453 RepID=UPI0024076FF7|nr:cyclic AMP-responsive element-binding protein 3-like protein 3-A [Dunckerocampus dactyliophorus]
MDLIDLLFRTKDETTSCHGNPPWPITMYDTLSPGEKDAEDFLDSLLAGSESSSAPTSPLWSPCTPGSDMCEDHLTDSPQMSSCTTFPALDTHTQSLPHLPSLKHETGTASDVSIDLGWESGDLQEQLGMAYYLTPSQSSAMSSSQTVTVKDLLLSNLGQKIIPQHPLQELVLSEDEKKLLAKEGINLPSKLPLSKLEERVLKKIRRKIRNKRSAQESRKKKREYVDSLEERMSACNAHNLQLQRKIHQLEETNNALLEHLSQLQALLPNSSNKTTQKGTCLLVLLLSFSLIISSNMKPNPYNQLSQGEYTETSVVSRSLQSVNEVKEVAATRPLFSISWSMESLSSLMEKLLKHHPSLDDHRMGNNH